MATTPTEAMLPKAFRVRRNRKETADTRTLELVSVNGDIAPAWRPGQFTMLYVFGVGEIPISISGDPAQREGITHTVRAVGPVSRAICGAKPGSVVGVRGPFGNAWPTSRLEECDVVLVAGGIGLAPLRPVLYTILRDRKRFGHVSLLVGSRTPDILLYRREMDRWRNRGIDVRVAVDSAVSGWRGSVGPVTTLIPRAEFNAPQAVAFIVGPEIMMRVVVGALARRGVPPARLFVSMERNMKCAIGLCGHCQLGPAFICKEGPVFPYSQMEPWLAVRNM